MSDLGGLREQDAWGLSRSFGRAERISAQKDKILGLERRGRCAGPLAARFCARPRVRGPILAPAEASDCVRTERRSERTSGGHAAGGLLGRRRRVQASNRAERD